MCKEYNRKQAICAKTNRKQAICEQGVFVQTFIIIKNHLNIGTQEFQWLMIQIFYFNLSAGQIQSLFQ